MKHPSYIKHDLITTSSHSSQTMSDILYLTIGIIAGVILILILILIAMCSLRLLQQKKIIGIYLIESFSRRNIIGKSIDFCSIFSSYSIKK